MITKKDIIKLTVSEADKLGSFSTNLMNLIGKADDKNKARIESIFPEYVEAYNLWYSGNTKGIDFVYNYREE